MRSLLLRSFAWVTYYRRQQFSQDKRKLAQNVFSTFSTIKPKMVITLRYERMKNVLYIVGENCYIFILKKKKQL